MIEGFRSQGFGFTVSGSGIGLRALGLGFRVPGSGLGWGFLGFRV